MAAAEECNTGLCLGLGVGEHAAGRHERPKDNNNKRSAARAFLDLSFTLCPKDEDTGRMDHNLSIGSGSKMSQDDGKAGVGNSNSKRINISGRKKLRLTIEQSRLLEDSFKLHTTLNSKQALAEQLNLEPRQVEVWFQNRRARTKLKQNEVDCEFLKKCCESLTDENKRLKKELQELQSAKAGASSPLFIQLQKAATCPSCEKIMRTSDEGKNAAVNTDVVLKNNKWQRGFNATNEPN
ncbi:homeobox-leucine zipper protein HAT22 [Citrus sinensis]|uniref:Homeobox-leucine zipper protein HAT22 n=1 Tax=Citrus sinensis TaxID=2711 RepID=A0ACB8P5K5_CITSI|nr:homeobox-leucine zipper protein HAT22 [Citrus sinensis]